MKRILAAIAAVYVCAVACDDDPKSHDYLAMLYEPARDCVDPSAPIGTIPTSDGSLLCAPTCLVFSSPPAAGGAKVYVSTMCGPYPDFTDTSGTDATCPAALAAYARGPDVCNADGTSTSPLDAGALAPADAGGNANGDGDGSASGDGSGDGGGDAASE